MRARITYIDRVIIRNFYCEDAGALLLEAAPSLPCNAELPRNVAAMLLPVELETKLSALPPGYYRVLTGSDVLLVEPGSHVVVDMLRDVLEGPRRYGDCTR